VTKPVIDVRDVSVHYRVPHERIRTFKEFAIKWIRGRVEYHTVRALSDVTVRVNRGEVVGILGRNGAGKSTLLKVIARVLRPTRGTVQTSGRVAPLLELGAGFDVELTGRENIFLNGALLGRTHREMRERVDRIVEFAELEESIDAPLRTYSTGMMARLGFAIATDVEPEILLIDEVLAVGDLGFQQRCHTRIDWFKRQGATLVLVSHAPATVEALCSRVIWLDHGRVAQDGPTATVLPAFVSNAMGHGPPAEGGCDHSTPPPRDMAVGGS
jgi:ABC-type polysaccharide/polyol phosphate transport system ATPase subunit